MISGVEKLANPDERVSLRLLERYGLAAAECLFLDDNTRNNQAAKLLALYTLHLKKDACLKDELKRLGIRGLEKGQR